MLLLRIKIKQKEDIIHSLFSKNQGLFGTILYKILLN